MSRKYFVREGDQVLFSPSFGIATVIGNLSVSVQVMSQQVVRVNRKLVCLVDDVDLIIIPSVNYVTVSATIPGTGMLKLRTPLPSQFKSDNIQVNGKFIFVYETGTTLPAELEVIVPALVPGTPPVPDTTPKYTGTATIVSTQTDVYTF